MRDKEEPWPVGVCALLMAGISAVMWTGLIWLVLVLSGVD